MTDSISLQVAAQTNKLLKGNGHAQLPPSATTKLGI